jgi:acetylglutamate kinase
MATAGDPALVNAAASSPFSSPAVGVCAADAGIVVAKKRKPSATSEGEVDFGAVGDVSAVDPAPLLGLIAQGVTPVVCPPVGDGEGSFLNLNADTLAASLAGALQAAKLVLLTGEAGILGDPDDPESVLSALGLATLEQLDASGALRAGMKVKAAAVRLAIQAGVPKVHIVSGVDPEALLVELYTSHGSGTLITAEEPEVANAAQPVA